MSHGTWLKLYLAAGALLIGLESLAQAGEPASDSAVVAAKPASDSAVVAAKVDLLLAKDAQAAAVASSEIKDTGAKPAPAAPTALAGAAARAGDVTLLRRLWLDVIGELPSPEQLSAYVLDPSADKLPREIDKLLADSRYGSNWARYWRDLILSRRSDERAMSAAASVVEYLSNQFNGGTSWDQIAREIITATGDVRESGATALIMAQMADPANTTAEVSRIFLGVQIQCAQCHDHRTDRWKREQFHELAAFFPRVGIRPVNKGDVRSFEVVSLARPGGRRAPGATEPVKLEHYMPDLENPKADGTKMRPVFFPTGQKLDFGASDKERRETLAEWMTSRSQGWFAKAFVNRMWGELVGRGFQEPIDDLGPDRKPTAPHALDFLAAQFTAHRYDVKWLFRTIVATEAYQRESRSGSDGAAAAAFSANCPRRLRADQLYSALVTVLGLEGLPLGNERGMNRPRGPLAGPRGQVSSTFGFDPSLPRDELSGSIPQTLYMMNSQLVNRAIDARRPAATIKKVMSAAPNDDAVVVDLYLRVLAREPKDAELSTCLEHVRTTASHGEAFEDILWALVNSTEFLHRK